MAILLEAGAFVNVQQSNGETALMKVNASHGSLGPQSLHRWTVLGAGSGMGSRTVSGLKKVTEQEDKETRSS